MTLGKLLGEATGFEKELTYDVLKGMIGKIKRKENIKLLRKSIDKSFKQGLIDNKQKSELEGDVESKNIFEADIETDYANEIGSGTGLRGKFVLDFMQNNGIGGYDLLGIVASKKISRADFNTALVGFQDDSNPYYKKLMKLIAKVRKAK